jgi:hypothetical protein
MAVQKQVVVNNRPETRFSYTKEEIDMKRREVLARRQISQSQATR